MKKTVSKGRRKLLSRIAAVICCLLLFIAFLAFSSAKWYVETYGQLGFDSILYTLFSNLNGVESDLLVRYAKAAIVPTVICTGLLGLYLFFSWDKKLVLHVLPRFQMTLFPVRRWIAILCSIALCAGLLYQAATISQFKDYLIYLSKGSTIYQDEYIDPKDTEVTFPEEKRNLVYIFLESMENTFFSTEQGGVLPTCAIPELYELAANNVNFSCDNGVGGLYSSSGSSWTIGAMVAQTAGIPLKTPPGVGGNDYGTENTFLPGITSLTDILHRNGYYQTLMVGSDATFGGRKTYFEEHGIDQIYDLYTAREDGIVAPDYKVWWGMEDSHLYRYAQQELIEISAQDQPFAFFMLTVDTHHIGGYVCPYCDDSYTHQYENVLACASRQLAEFLQWLQAQPFYENTSIVIVGDHPTMDIEYLNTVGAEGASRCVYNCFVNSAVQPTKTRGRVAYTLDMFPTTLSSMGCTIPGDRLGLGTNLFSDTPTLGEVMGRDGFNSELMKNSSYYTKEFFFNH